MTQLISYQLTSAVKNETQKPVAPVNSGNLDEALSRIYQRYGLDLQAFFRDAYREALLKCQDQKKDI